MTDKTSSLPANPLSKTIVALDNMDQASLKVFLKEGKDIPMIKIGLEMFYALGPDFVRDIFRDYQKEIFLDLKLHDIPNTVNSAIKSLSELPIRFLTIHLSGGLEMINQAVATAAEFIPNTTLLGVSYLTSLGAEDLKKIWGIENSPRAYQQMFSLALESNIQGLILSAWELELVNRLEKKYNKSLIKICPGIRFQDEIDREKSQDQKRVASPEMAMSHGASFLVIGRSLTKAHNVPSRISQLQTMPY